MYIIYYEEHFYGAAEMAIVFMDSAGQCVWKHRTQSKRN